METINVIIKFFQEGGFWMYPISLVMAIGFAIAFERFTFLNRAYKQNQKAWEQVLPAAKQGNLDEAARILNGSDSHIAHVLKYGLEQRKTSVHRDDIETALEEGLMEVIPKIEKRTHFIATFANMATLLGLLGTIIGLIQAFVAVANADPADKANLLSASISVAMNTTAYGLIVAIPLLLVFSVLQSRTTEIVDSLEMACVKFVNMISGENVKK